MTVSEAEYLFKCLSDPSVKAKHFSIKSLTHLTFIKRKLQEISKDYWAWVDEIGAAKGKKVQAENGTFQYIRQDDSDEAKNNFSDFLKALTEKSNESHEVKDLNTIPIEEIAKVGEDSTLEITTTLIYWLGPKEA